MHALWRTTRRSERISWLCSRTHRIAKARDLGAQRSYLLLEISEPPATVLVVAGI